MSSAPLDTFIQVVGVLLTLSVASERLVEVLKGYLPWLGQTRTGERDDARRRSHLLVATTVVNLCTTWLAWPMIVQTPAIAKIDSFLTMIGFALLASGGSSMWNSVLSYLVGMKDIKKSEAKVAKLEMAEATARFAGSPVVLRNELANASFKGLGGTAQ
jgi:hypothetical protein